MQEFDDVYPDMNRSISASMIRDLLICERRLALDAEGDPSLRDPVSPFVSMLWRDGLAHEDAVLAALHGPVADLRGRDRADRERETGIAMARGVPTILGAATRHGDLVGMPDLLILTPRGYVAQDVKSGSALEGANGAYKKEYLVQVAHYALILERAGLGPGDTAGIIGHDGRAVAYDLELPLGRAAISGRGLHAELLGRARSIVSGRVETRAALSAQCGMCEWRSVCRDDLARRDDLTLIAGLGRAVRTPIEAIATTVADLAALDADVLTALPGVGADRLRRFVDRARLLADPAAGPVCRAPLGLPAGAHAIDFDVEADPMRGIVYLHGFWHDRADGGGGFVHFFAETPDADGERHAFGEAIDHFREHRSADWFHYSAYERTAYRDLQRRHPDVCDAAEIDEIFAAGRCTDLYAVVAARTDWPLSSYGIKSIAKTCGFSWEDTDPGGAASIEWYDRWVATGDEALRRRIIAYNRDDVRASARVRQALAELEASGAIAGFRRP